MTEAGTIWKLVDHPLRREVWRRVLVEDKPLSPKDISVEMGQSLGTVAYHVGCLADREAIVLTHREPVRGAYKNFYVSSDRFDRLKVLRIIKELNG